MAILRGPLSLGDELRPQSILPPPQIPEDVDAMKLVLKDLNRSEYYLLAKGMTVEWDRDDRLYLFRVPQAFWEGSSVPRASLGVPLIYEHIESLLPQVMSSIYSDSTPFLCFPRPKTDMDVARAAGNILSYQLDNMNFREELRLVAKEALVYGTGVIKWGWKRYTRTVTKYERKGPPTVEAVGTGTVKVPTKASETILEKTEEIEVNEPYAEHVHIRHLVVDPALRTPDIRDAKYVIHRLYLSVQDMDKLRDQPGYNIPAQADLEMLFYPPKEMAERSLLEGRTTSSVLNTGVSSLDINMEFKAMPRWQDSTADPTAQPLEVLEYWTADRCIVVLNRKLCIKNDLNPFGKIPFASVPYTDVLDNFYGIGVAKLLGGEQRLQQGVINTRLDDLILRLSGTFIRKRGANTPTQQLRLRPGGIIDTDDEKGIQMIQYPPAITDAFTEVEASDQRAQRRTGANEITSQGSLGQRTSLTRTATGISTLAAGSSARIEYFIGQLSNMVVIPTLDAFHEMNAKWLDVKTISTILSDELAMDYKGDALDIKNAKLKFEMLSSTKVTAQQKMSQSLPTLYQFLTSQPVIEALAQEQKKVNVAELAQMVLDISGWPNRNSLIVPMTQQDIQMQQQNNPNVQKAQQIQQQAQNDQSLAETKGSAKLASDGIQAVMKMAADRSTRNELMKDSSPGLLEV